MESSNFIWGDENKNYSPPKPLISDEEWDKLYKEVLEKETGIKLNEIFRTNEGTH